MTARHEQALQTLPRGKQIRRALEQNMVPGTAKTYSSSLRKWLLYAVARKMDPYNGTTLDVCDYLVFLADEGSVAVPDSCDAYLAAINNAYAAKGLPKIATSPEVSGVLKHYAGTHRHTTNPPRIVPLPAAIAERFLLTALEVEHHLTSSSPFYEQHLQLLVALTASLTTFVTGSRPSSIRTLTPSCIVFPDTGTVITRNYAKGANHSDNRNLTGLQPVTLPPCDAYDKITFLLKRIDEHLPSNRRYFFTTSGISSVTSARWLDLALLSINNDQPPNTKYTPKSFRQGFATSTRALNIPEDRVNAVAGWKPGSKTADNTYVDYSVTADDACHYFFDVRR